MQHQRDKHYPDEIRFLLKKYNSDPQSMTTKETKVLRDFSEKENISLNDLLGALPEAPPVQEFSRAADIAPELPRQKLLFNGQFYDLVLQYGDIQFGYNLNDNPYDKAGELIRQYNLSQSLDYTALRSQIASIIQETVRKRAGEEHLDKLFPDEVRVRATLEEKKEYASSVRNANILIQRKVMEDEARKKKKRKNILDAIRWNQKQLLKKDKGEVRLTMKDGVLRHERVPRGIPEDQLSAILQDAERKERLEAAQERQKANPSKPPPALARKQSTKRRGMLSFQDLQEEDKKTNPLMFQQPREGYFRVREPDGTEKEVPIPVEWDAKLVAAYSQIFFGFNVTLLMNFLRDIVKMDEAALTYVDQNIDRWNLKLIQGMIMSGALGNNSDDVCTCPNCTLRSTLVASAKQAMELEKKDLEEETVTASLGTTKQAMELEKKALEEETVTASLGTKEDMLSLPIQGPDGELNIDDLPEQSGTKEQEQNLDLNQDDADNSGRGAVKPDVVGLDGEAERTVAEETDKKELTEESNVDVLMNIDYESDWIWIRPSAANTAVQMPVKQKSSSRFRGLNDLNSTAPNPFSAFGQGASAGANMNQAGSALNRSSSVNKVVAFSGTGFSLVSKANKEAVEEPEAPPGEFVFDGAGEFVTIRIRLASAKVITQKFNTHHTIQDIRNFLDSRHSCGTRLYSLKVQGRPPVLLPRDDKRTVKQAKLNRVCILQSKS